VRGLGTILILKNQEKILLKILLIPMNPNIVGMLGVKKYFAVLHVQIKYLLIRY
jgi:hypothetical protein